MCSCEVSPGRTPSCVGHPPIPLNTHGIGLHLNTHTSAFDHLSLPLFFSLLSLSVIHLNFPLSLSVFILYIFHLSFITRFISLSQFTLLFTFTIFFFLSLSLIFTIIILFPHNQSRPSAARRVLSLYTRYYRAIN